MKALVILGNMGAGKSTLARMIIEKYPNWTRFVIDDYRHKDYPEQKAREWLLADMARCRTNIVYETTAAGLAHSKAMKLLEGKDILKVMLGVSLETAIERVKNRAAATINPTGRSFEESWQYMNEKLKGEWCDLYFDTELLEILTICESITSGFRVKMDGRCDYAVIPPTITKPSDNLEKDLLNSLQD